MKEESGYLECRYVVDQNARIVSVSDNWSVVASDNGVGSDLKKEDVIGRSLFDFIADAHCQELYKALIKKVSHTGDASSFPFRCDTPLRRRLMELYIRDRGDDQIEFDVALLLDDQRPEPCLLLEADRPVSDAEVTICSWCKCVEVGDDWLEVEEATAALRTSDDAPLPQLKHGICDQCDEIVKDALGSE